MFRCLNDISLSIHITQMCVYVCVHHTFSLTVVSPEHSNVAITLVSLTYFRMQLSPWEITYVISVECHQNSFSLKFPSPELTHSRFREIPIFNNLYFSFSLNTGPLVLEAGSIFVLLAPRLIRGGEALEGWQMAALPTAAPTTFAAAAWRWQLQTCCRKVVPLSGEGEGPAFVL